MKKKVFVDRNARRTPKRPSYMKLVLCAALALILFAVVAPRMMRKSDQEVVRKPENSKGMVVKEIPKAGSPSEDMLPKDVQSSHGMQTDGESRTASAPEMTMPPVGGEKEKPELLPEKQLRPLTGTGFEAKGRESEQKKPVPTGGGISTQSTAVEKGKEQPLPSREYDFASQSKSNVPPKGPEVPQSPSLNGTQKETTGAPTEANTPKATSASHENSTAALKAASPTPPKATKPSSSEKQLFVVQVGSFKAKQNAEEIKLALEKKGYTVVLKPYLHSKLGQLYTVQLAPVADFGKANTLMMQIRHESNVKPYVIKVPAEQ